MKKQQHRQPIKNSIYRNINVSVKLMDAVIIGGLAVIALVIFVSASV